MGSKAFILHEETEAQRQSWIRTSCLGFQSQVLGKNHILLHLSLPRFPPPSYVPAPYSNYPSFCLSLFSLPSHSGWSYFYPVQITDHHNTYPARRTPCTLFHENTWDERHVGGSAFIWWLWNLGNLMFFACTYGSYSVVFRHSERHTEPSHQKKSTKAKENTAQLPNSIICAVSQMENNLNIETWVFHSSGDVLKHNFTSQSLI